MSQTTPDDPQAYVQQVMAEIAEEVRLRRASGDLPPKLERELDELFLAHSPVAGRGGDLGDALRMVDAVTFIDPVVPVESERAAGAYVKKGMRSLLLWYVGWVTHQMSQSAAAVSRALHIVDDRLGELERQVQTERTPEAAVVEFSGWSGPGAWWADPAAAAVAKVPGRVLHAACGDGWLVRRIAEAGGDAYGIDPRAHVVDAAELERARRPPGEPRRAPARRGRVGAGRHSAQRAGRRHVRWPTGARAQSGRDAARSRRGAGHPLGHAGDLGGGRRARRGGPRPGPAASARLLGAPAVGERVRGRCPDGSRGRRLPRGRRRGASVISPFQR